MQPCRHSNPLAELLSVGQDGASTCGAILGLSARPLIDALMQIARSLREDTISALRAMAGLTLGLGQHGSTATASRVLPPRGTHRESWTSPCKFMDGTTVMARLKTWRWGT